MMRRDFMGLQQLDHEGLTIGFQSLDLILCVMEKSSSRQAGCIVVGFMCVSELLLSSHTEMHKSQRGGLEVPGGGGCRVWGKSTVAIPIGVDSRG
jgi:hypothetical protein